MQRMREQLSRMERRKTADRGGRRARARPRRGRRVTGWRRAEPRRAGLPRQPRRRALDAARAQRACATSRGSTGQVGATPKDVVWRRDKAELWRYRSGPVRYGPPVLIVHSLVSRSYILDLRPGSSLVEYLTDAGLDVFLLDWGVPDELDADNDLETLRRRLPAARARGGAARDRLRRGDARRLLPRRRLAALYAAATRTPPCATSS